MSVKIKDFTRIERRSEYILPIELYWRLQVTSLWVFYWLFLASFIFGAIFDLCLWLPQIQGTIVKGMNAPTRELLGWFRGYYPALLLVGIPFYFVTAKASISYARGWSYVALAGWGFETIATLFRVFETRHLTRLLWPVGVESAIAVMMTTTFNLCMIAGLWQIVRADATEARLCSTTSGFSLFPRKAVRRLSILPYGLRFVQRRRGWTTLLLLMGAGAQMTVAWNLSQATSRVTDDEMKMVGECSSRQYYEEKSRADLWRFLVSNLVAMGVFPLLGNKILAAGRRRITFSLGQTSRMDSREPILFLRSFKEDRAALPKPRLSPLGRLLLFGRPAKSIDEVLLEEASRYGPVIAAGSPSDLEPPFGAARGYFDNSEWQSVVSELINRSRLIVVCVDQTRGIHWELNEILEHGGYRKALFLLPDALVHRGENREVIQMIKRRSLEGNIIDPPENSGGSATIGWFRDGDASAVELRSNQCSDLAFGLAIRLFLRTRLGAGPAFP